MQHSVHHILVKAMLFINVSKGIRVHIIYHSQVCHVQLFYTKLSFQYSSNKSNLMHVFKT